MKTDTVGLRGCRFEVLSEGDRFVGLGRVWIGAALVRSGRLPLRCFSQSFGGQELAGLRLLKVEAGSAEVRIRLEALFRRLPVKVMRDHSFDPIHEMGDWDRDTIAGKGRLDLVLRPARDTFNGAPFEGFAYHWEYRSRDVPLYWIMDMASWELDGDIDGATVYSQSSCSAPVQTFDKANAWSTEGILFFLIEAGNENPVMTHNLPRWAGHGAFDYQFKGDRTLIGVFERVDLIRSVLVRDAGRPELKCFDKHVFDQSCRQATAAKKILLNAAPKTTVGQQNLWTWVYDEVDRRALAEFGMQATPTIPLLAVNFWEQFTVDSYYKDLLPAAVNLGVKQVFVDNLKKSAMTERAPLPGVFNWNMCCGHEYEISDKLGGVKRVRAFIDECAQHGIRVLSWTNNDQALSSPINKAERAQAGDWWYVLLEDTRQKYGGAYMGCMSVLDFAEPAARTYFVDSHIKIHRETGSDFFFDSFYNLGFMPVNYRHMAPRTMWRGLLQAFKRMQDAGIRLTIESFGPWGQPIHGHSSGYNMDTIFACYRVGMGNDYSTVPGTQALKDINPKGADGLYYQLAHRACLSLPLEVDGKRVDRVWGAPFRQALADYHAVLPRLGRRVLQEDGLGVLWEARKGRQKALFNFQPRRLALPGRVLDVTAGEVLPPGKVYRLKACHTYTFAG
jgi:hypothetical protein